MKKTFILLLALSLVFCFCACSAIFGDEPSPTAEPVKTDAPAETSAPADTDAPVQTDAPVYERTPAEFVGIWRYEDREGCIRIYDDWIWSAYDDDMNCLMVGGCRYEDEYGLVLESDDGSDYDFLRPNEDGTLYNSAFVTLFPEESQQEVGTDFTEYVGTWVNDASGVYVCIYEDWTWAVFDGMGGILSNGGCMMDSEFGLVLETYEDTDYDYLHMNEDGTIYNSVFDTLYRTYEPIPNGLEDTPANFVGAWQNTETGTYLYIYTDMTWAAYDEWGEYDCGGNCRYDDVYGLVLELDETQDHDFLRVDSDGTLYNALYETLVRCEDFFTGN